ncbi:unnamed protein product [Caenorhabditis bovis]|uniref:NF-kappa-B-activating protein C-terminal domain-containing protein n=1 Tax=Caenorhabditis bovis TaxID=2654633 RepID=A0A8S1F5D5_9PELO|nr:unnamed protein product [Caenorhabditis bovis]
MSDVSLDYSEESDNSRSSSRRSSISKNGDKPLWKSRKGSESSRSSSRSRSPKKKRSPIRAPTPSPPSRMRGGRSASPRNRRRSRTRSPRRRRSPDRRRRSRSPRRSPGYRRRSPISRRRSPSYDRDSRSPRRDYRRQRSPTTYRNENHNGDMWEQRRSVRFEIQKHGEKSVWGESPSQRDIEETYRLKEVADAAQIEQEKKGAKLKADREKAKRKEERKRRRLAELSGSDSSSDLSDDSDDEKHSKKKKKKKSKKSKKKKSKKEKKEKKKKEKEAKVGIAKNDDDSSEWEERPCASPVETGKEGSYSPGPIIPEHIKSRNEIQNRIDDTNISYGKDLLRGEGAGMAAYVARGERIPRRGEIGLSSNEIQQFEKWGYVMSGSRHKAMEATRLRKENQILTAEEKRLLSGVSMEAKKKKEEAVLEQFRSLIKNKNMRS